MVEVAVAVIGCGSCELADVLSMQSISMGLLACNVEIQHGDETHTSCTTPIAAWFSLQAGRMYHGRFQSGCGSVSQRLEAEVVSTW